MKNPEKPFVAILGRRQGQRQDRGHREPAAQGRRAADRRRDGLHVPQGAGRRGRQEPRRGGQARRWRRKLAGVGAAAQGVELVLPVDHVVRHRASTDKSDGERDRPTSAIPDGPDGARHRPEDAGAVHRSTSATAKTVFWNGPMGLFEVDEVRRGHARGGAGHGGQHAARSRWSAAATARRRCSEMGFGEQDHARVHRRRRVARVPRGP